ncbi:MAG: DUF2249 domain-containing protein [Porphyromonadaceae bacterium]|nr:DUF2249 domain-containing protein [Porphyromonadaceae bacterium]
MVEQGAYVGTPRPPALGENFCLDGEEGTLTVSQIAPETPVTFTLDVRPIIDAGNHPKDIVLTQAEKLLPGECMELISPFPPVPLINLLQNKGFKVRYNNVTHYRNVP